MMSNAGFIPSTVGKARGPTVAALMSRSVGFLGF